MIRIQISRAMLRVLFSGLAISWMGAARADDSVDDKLDAPLALAPRPRLLADTLAELSKRIGVAVAVDYAAFGREKMEFNGKQKTWVSRATFRGRTTLEWV